MAVPGRPVAGDYFLVRTSGLFGVLIRWATRSRWSHAGVYVGDGRIVESWTSGARISDVTSWPDAAWSHFDLDEQQRQGIATAALSLVGTPYGWLDIAAISLGTFGITLGPIGRRISNDGTMICSQLVDSAYERAGVHLFNDGRLPGMVTPGDLGRLAGFAAPTEKVKP